ncbi:MAG: PAC2 family protein [Nitrososphaeria archaeon]
MVIKIYANDEKFEGCSLITGFHGIGFTGYWSVKFLIQQLKAERVGFVESIFSPPICTIHDRKIVTPFELYRKDKLVFFKAEVSPPREKEYSFYSKLADWIASSGFKEAFLIGGLDSSLKVDNTSYRLVHTSKYVMPEVLKDSLILEDDRLIVGPIAILLNHFEAIGFPTLSVLSFAAQNRLDPRACAEALSVFSKVYDVTIDVKPLIEGAEAIEAELAKPAVKEEGSGKELGSFYS